MNCAAVKNLKRGVWGEKIVFSPEAFTSLQKEKEY
jgi:hypothetical protein